MDEKVDVIGHEDVGEDHEVMFHCCLIDSICQSLADAIIFQERLSVVG